MHERRRNILVGVTAICGLVGFAALLVLFGYVPRWMQEGYPLRIAFADAGGLTSGSRVRLSGIDVGVVERVELQPPPATGVLVTAQINEDVVVPPGVRATIDAPIIGGGAWLSLDISQVPPDQRSARIPADTVIVGGNGGMMDQFSSQLERTLAQPIADFRALQRNFASLSEDLEELSDQWTRVGRNIEQLTAAQTPDAVDTGDASPNLTTVIARLDATVRQAQSVAAGLDRWVNDAQLHEDVRTTAANARNVSGRLSDGVDKVTELTDTARASFDQLTRRYTALADDLSREIARAGTLLEDARAGEGTVGRLIQDPALYNNLNDTVQRMDRAITDLRLLIQKWQAEGLPVRF